MFSTYGRPADMFGDLGRLQGILERAFQPPERGNIRALNGAAFPVINLGSTAEAVEVMAMAPGLDPAKLEITVDRGLLVIAGERVAPTAPGKGQAVYAQERFYGPFRRVVALSADVDPTKIDAMYRDGALRITLSKRESSKPRRIPIN